ncbi:MAG: hypothetical protein K6T57_08655 [Thermaceae bacterium]|nr:hypothetical protein [Thermaceae bacterium]
MYLLVGSPLDACIAQVSHRLRLQGDAVLVTPEPLAGEGRVCWELSSERSASRLELGGQRIAETEWRGVMVRGMGGPSQPAEWEQRDYAYMGAESQSALLAWLKSLPCPVVNPPQAEIFYRERTLPEQRVWLHRAGFSMPPLLLTNRLAQARAFARRWEGRLSYVPLTSATRYPIDSPSQWAELERLMAHFPVLLMEPEAPSLYLSLAADVAVWSGDPPSGRARGRLERSAQRLARLLGVSMLQLELRMGEGSTQAVGFGLHPEFGWHPQAQQEALAEGIVRAMQGVRS